MRADRTADERRIDRRIDWSAVKPELAGGLKHGIVDLLKRRPNSVVRPNDIIRWFQATPARFVCDALNELLDEGRIRLVRTSFSRKPAHGGYAYVLPDTGQVTPAPKPNVLVKNTNQVLAKVQAAIEQLGHIGQAVDDRDLRRVEGLLDDARCTLQAAAARFERHGIDFPAVMG